MNIPKTYNPQETEKRIYSLWEKSGYFNPDNLSKKSKEAFSILMPPPNANDPLHLGHALFVTLEDIMIRYNRMLGKKTLWLPGADHAGFETQVVYERKLKKEGRSRFEMTREEFYKNVWEYTQKNREIVKEQLKKLGSSCDWTRDTFTLDNHIVKATCETFKKMADEGLVYRGKRLVNYCVTHKTAFSDLEVEHIEKKDPLYFMIYGPIVVATVRPETKFGDIAIAVHPDDKRYKKYVGQELKVKTLLGERKIKVISDKKVDPDFGTGAVKVTPAHDHNDYEMWLKHKKELPDPIQVIDENGKLTKEAGHYQGLKVQEARKKVSEDMAKEGLIKKIDENYIHSISVCYKCKNPIEPMLKEQWFISVKSLTKPAIDAVKDKKITIIPKNYEKIYFHWLKNLRDWNISRQNWWGINIPAWKCEDCFNEGKEEWIITNGETPQKCSICNGKKLIQDPDVFDTWFSSSQWPFATLRFPNHKDFKEFYPTSVLETGYDILPFWVIRMVLLGIYRTGEVPFIYIYLHGLIRAKDRQKMSKSKGNVIDPMIAVDNYGSDALRLALIAGGSPGKDLVITDEKIRGYRNYINKLWNIFRFLMMSLEEYELPRKQPKLSKKDEKIIKDFEKKAEKMTILMNKFRFSQALEIIYHYSWHYFADKLIEESKDILKNKEDKKSRQYTLLYIFLGIIKMLHPFAPFITEEIYQLMPIKSKKETLMIETFL